MDAHAARRLIVAYAIALGLAEITVALPGGPSFADSGFAFSVIVDTLIIWRLWHASAGAWVVGVLWALLALPLTFLMGAPADLGSILLIIFTLAQISLLATPQIIRFVWSRSGATAAPI